MITISLCMIVKNEEDVLGRVLTQMQDIADEIIIVDTGSTDRTKEIARQFTAQVYDYPWQQDFAAARNFACSQARMDYWMWLDADDVIRPDQQKALLELKAALDPDTDIVMMRYLTGFDQNGKNTFFYYRERLIKNHRQFYWQGKVHEAITPSGHVIYSPIEIEHRKEKEGDNDRNLQIYEAQIAEGGILEPRHQFYYGRELYYHKRYQEAIQVFEHFLQEPAGWVENQIDACLQLSHCYAKLGDLPKALQALTGSFLYDLPRAEICCELGKLFLESSQLDRAIYWYQQALSQTPQEQSGGFVLKDCYGFIPYVQLCVCYDRLGEHDQAFAYHNLAKALKPESEAVRFNEAYFDQLFTQQRIKK